MQSDRASSSGSGRSNSGGTTTKVVSRRVEPGELMQNGTGPKPGEEWKTSRKIINHKKKQVETRVQRKIIMEDGKVIADSGPQITTKTTEDNHVEETENTEKKNLGDSADAGIIAIPGSGKVVSEKTETTQTMKEIKEENMQLHNETIEEITGQELHKLALARPGGELAFSPMPDDSKPFQGKLTHYSAKSQKITDKEETKEISRLNRDGEITTETTKTHHHEEAYDDEVPEDQVKGQALPEASAETTRKIEFYRDGDEVNSTSDRLRKETEQKMLRALSPERRDAVTSKTLDFSEEEEIRNSETNRWLENHFGSDESDIVDTTKTKAGGNVIKIEMSTSRRPSPKEPGSSTGRNGRSSMEEQEESFDHHSRTKNNKSSTYVMNDASSQFRSDTKQHYTYRSSPERETPTTRKSSSLSPDVKKSSLGRPSRREASPVRSGSPIRSTPTRSKKTYYMGEQESPKPVRSSEQSRSSPVHHSTPLRRQPALWRSSPSLQEGYMYDEQAEEKLKRYDAYHISTNSHRHSPVHKVNSHSRLSSSESPTRSRSPDRYYRSDESRLSSKHHSKYQDSHKTERTHKSTKEHSREGRGNTYVKDYHRNGAVDSSTVYATVKKSKHKEKRDCSVQASLSDEEEEAARLAAYRKRHNSSPVVSKIEIRDTQTVPRSSKKSSRREKEEKMTTSLTNTPTSSLTRPSKTFYFGDPSDTHYHSTRSSTLDRSSKRGQVGEYSKKIVHTFDKDRNAHPTVTYLPGNYHTVERDNRSKNRNTSSKYRSYDDLRNGHQTMVHKIDRSSGLEETLMRKNMNRSLGSSLNERSYTDGHSENVTSRSFNSSLHTSARNGRNHQDTRTDESNSKNYHSKTSVLNNSDTSSRSVHDRTQDERSFSSNHYSSSARKENLRSESSRRLFMQDLLSPSDGDGGIWRSNSNSSLSVKKPLPESSRQRQHSDYGSPVSSRSSYYRSKERSPSPSSPMPRLIKVNGNEHRGYQRSPSPPVSPSTIPPPPPFQSNSTSYQSTGTGSNLAKNRPSSFDTKFKSSPPANPPNFTPLLSPTEIKNMANVLSSRSRARREENEKYLRVRPEHDDGAVVVEVREWDNR